MVVFLHRSSVFTDGGIAVLQIRQKSKPENNEKIQFVLGKSNLGVSPGPQTSIANAKTSIAVPIYFQHTFDKTLLKIKKIGEGGDAQVWLCDIIATGEEKALL